MLHESALGLSPSLGLGPGVEDFSTLPQFAIEFATTRGKKPHAHDDTTIRGTGHGN